MHEKDGTQQKNISAFSTLCFLPSIVALYCTGPVWFVLVYEAGDVCLHELQKQQEGLQIKG